MCTHTYTLIGLTSSLDNLLKTTSPAKRRKLELSVHDPLQSSSDLAEETNSPIELVTGQNIASSDTSSDSTHSLGQQSKDDSIQEMDSTHHSRLIDKSTSTVPCDSGTSIIYSMHKDLHQSEGHTDSHDASTGESETSRTHHPMSMTSTPVDVSLEPAYKAIIHCHDKLVTALSTDILSISGVLVAKEFVPAELSCKMLLPNLTPQEKATSLVIAIKEKIKLAPSRFQELIKIFSEQICTKDIVKSLSFHDSCEQDVDDNPQDCNMEVVSHSQQYAVCEGRMYTAWVDLKPADKIDLEARLITDAEVIREEFALLCWKVRDSFEQRDIKPRTLASALLDLTINEDLSDGNSGIPLLKEKEEALMSAKSVHDTFDVLRPHMNFFNYEILQFLIKGKGSKDDKMALSTFLKNFEEFCKRHIFEVPFTVYSNDQNSDNPIMQQRLHVKLTRHFKAALLTWGASESVPTPSDSTQIEKICSNKLGINLEDAKKIQRKFAKVLNLKPSSLFLDSISEGSVILTFLLPGSVSLVDLDNNPEIVLLLSNGVIILCGPPGKPELKELTPNGIVVRWSPPEYGCDSLAQYILYYQKQCKHDETSEWQMIKLNSFQTHTCVPDLNDGDTYVFKICTVSDVGTLQYSNESSPIVLSADQILTNNIHKVIVANKDKLTSAFSSVEPNKIALTLSMNGVISKENEAQISLASTPSKKATLLVAAIENGINSVPEKFQDFLHALSEAKLSLPGDVVETLCSEYYDSVYEQYLDYLKYLYASLDKKQTTSNQWPPSATKKFFRLAMIKTTTVRRGYIDDRFVQMTITGKVDDILLEKSPIQLEDIFKETKGQRKVILLEGAPGCGKSTLSVYICQQWEKGQLFNQFQLVILIRLRDPAIKNAKGLADLLPCPDTKTAQEIAARMLANKCKDVLFILDGRDELPPNLRKNSIFLQLVQPELPQSNPLCESTVIVTSRPISSGDLHQVVSSRVEILGFTANELQQFFTDCLKGDTEAVKTLLERIEENPEVAGSCYLPLNATILVHLFKNDRNTLPTTLYGIFSSLVLSCMQRHLKLRTQYKDVSIESLDQLPEVAKKPFSVLCQLAYDGVMENNIIFTSLPADVNTLSLLQGVESFIGREKAVSHNFIHLSIQELLAAWYIATQLPASEQVSKFNELFHTSRFSAIFQYYSAITKLKTPGIKDVVVSVVKKHSRSQGDSSSKENKVCVLSLLHCLYEARDSSLCESVAQQLQRELHLMNTTPTPSDCLCIGYFLAHVCKMTAGEFRVYIYNCSIDDQGCKYLVSGLHKYLDTHSAATTLLHIDMENNAISHHGLHHLSTLLKIGCIDGLALSANNLLSEQDTIHSAIDAFTKQLKYNTTLKTLRLKRCGLTSLSAESLAEALTTNKHLEVMSIDENALYDDGIQHLAHALRVNQGLKTLSLVSCGMTDVGLECLAKSLQHNNVLTQLRVWNYSSNPNRITEKIVPVLTECLQNNHTLTELVLPLNLVSSTTSIEEAVNDVRKRSGLPLIKVTGMYVPLNEDSLYMYM